MKVDPRRMVSISTVAAAFLVLLLLVILVLARALGHAPIGSSPESILRPLTPLQISLWGMTNGLYGLYYLLLVPSLWLVYQALKAENPAAATIGLLFGLLALVAESLGRWWHLALEVPIAGAFQTSPTPEAERALTDLLTRYAGYHHALHYSSYLIVMWAALLLATVLHHRVLPMWLALLSFAMVVAVGPFPPAALAWAVPAVFLTRGAAEGARAEPVRAARRRMARPNSAARSRR